MGGIFKKKENQLKLNNNNQHLAHEKKLLITILLSFID